MYKLKEKEEEEDETKRMDFPPLQRMYVYKLCMLMHTCYLSPKEIPGI